MNTPNKLTILRVILIPVFMLFYLMDGTVTLCIALGVFLLAALTDHYDGKLARKNNQITTFGKLMDPMADKLLILAALICYVQCSVKYVNAAVVVIILARELIVTGVRMLALDENTVIAASIWGKAKTVSQFILTVAVMVFEVLAAFLPQTAAVTDIIILILVTVAVILTIFSGWDYVWKNRGLLTFK